MVPFWSLARGASPGENHKPWKGDRPPRPGVRSVALPGLVPIASVNPGLAPRANDYRPFGAETRPLPLQLPGGAHLPGEELVRLGVVEHVGLRVPAELQP